MVEDGRQITTVRVVSSSSGNKGGNMKWFDKLKCKLFKSHTYQLYKNGAVYRWRCPHCGMFAPKKKT